MGQTISYIIYNPSMFDIQKLYNAVLAYSHSKINLPHKVYPIPGLKANFPLVRSTVSGIVSNIEFSTCHIEVFSVSDTLYPINTRVKFLINSDGTWDTARGPYEAIGPEASAFPIGVPAKFNPPMLVLLRLNEDLDDGSPQTLAHIYKSTGLVRSYNVPYDDRLEFQSYMYDQALAIIAACIMGDQVSASILVDALLSVQRSDGQWPFQVNVISKYCEDAYFRTGTIMFCIYSLAFYYKKFTAIIQADSKIVIKTAIQKSMHYMIDTYLVVSPSDMRYGLFRGGKGRYSNNIFDPNYYITWCANEHNVDAYFTIKILISLGFSEPNLGYDYTSILELLKTAMFSVMWNSTEEMARLAIQNENTPSINNSLDNNTWYGMMAADCGILSKAEKGMEIAEKYYKYSGTISDMDAPVAGYKMYSKLSDEPESYHVWGEGTAGGICAYRMIANATYNPLKKIKYLKRANSLLTGYQYMNDSTDNFGVRYTSERRDNDNFCISSTVWTIIAILGRGFWNLN